MISPILITQATLSDLPSIMKVIEDAQAVLKLQHSGQWQDGSPSIVTIRNDIENNNFYVAKKEHSVVGVFALLSYEPAYDNLLSGVWRFQAPYLVIHRFAVSSSFARQGIATKMLNYCEEIAKQNHIHVLRVDTHDKNIPMKNLLIKHGYQFAGTTLIDGTKLRSAYEKYIRESL